MPYLIGIVLAIGVSILARVVRFDRDRAFYPTVLIVIASYYDLFAVMGGSTSALAIESTVVAGFVLVSILGFKSNLWWIAGAMGAHGVFDFFHGQILTNPGVPIWWPRFCMAYDLAAGASLAWLLNRSTFPAKKP